MFVLVQDDTEFDSLGFDNCLDKPLGYPCLVKYDNSKLVAIYIPKNIKCIQSFLAGANSVKHENPK